MSYNINNIISINHDILELFEYVCYVPVCTEDKIYIHHLKEYQVRGMERSEGITREEFLEKYALPHDLLVEIGCIEEEE